jgi:ribosomal protein S18 acetylase RimI-like enzyme
MGAATHADAIRVVPLDPQALGPAAIASARELCPPGRTRELFDRALGDNPECRGLAVFDGDGAAAGLVFVGLVAGTSGTGAILWIGVRPDRRRHGIARALLALAKAELVAEQARTVIAELPEEEATASMIKLLGAAGFERDGTVPDYFRDGVPLTIWRWTPR